MKGEITDKYVHELLERLKVEPNVVKDCSIFENNERHWKAVITTLDDSKLFTEFSMYTYSGVKQFTVKLEPQKVSNEFDKNLYDLKIHLKDVVRSEWEDCVWLEDEQSTAFAEELYGEIYRTENSLRQFINMVMVRTFGTSWWDNYIPQKLKDKYDSRHVAYKRIAESFKNVSDHLISIDTDDLIDLMTHVLKKWEPQHDKEIEKALEKTNLGQKELNQIIDKLRKQLVAEINLWDKIFEKYFGDGFVETWIEFSKNRNHVAHNKLLDLSAHEKIKKSIAIVASTIYSAKNKFELEHLSEEELEEIHAEFAEYEEEESELARQREIEFMEEEAGVKIKDEDAIFEEFNEHISNFVTSIADSIYFRNDINVKTEDLNRSEVTQGIILIESKINDSSLKVVTNIDIDDSAGQTSIVSLSLIVDGNEISTCELSYDNGDAKWNDDLGYYLPLVNNKLHIDYLGDFEKEILEKFEETFPNLVLEVESRKYEVVKNGGAEPVADFHCEECDEPLVSIDESLCDVGKCVNCGYEHSLEECLRCEQLYNSNVEGQNNFCDSCYEYLDRE
ncbi:hypothetical protein E6C60_0753 [Paenibacillus algicola]|uniref:Apea-like HEPN domain-containing protein n=1 Tax=Paenibacillus algicola TaxID=2565926 RepID=A0A4V1G3K1_9BACL|nr:hypothetical protein E6C60_0753 [Paenibacillus algicola]